MKGRAVTFLFLNIIAPVFQQDLTTGVNAELKALLHLGITDSTVDWRYAFGRLAERYLQKDDMIRKLNVLNFIRTHMKSILLKMDRFHYTTDETSSPLITMKRADIPYEDIPSIFQGTLEADFKTAYSQWYRIIMNSKDPRVSALVDTLKKEPFDLERSLTEQDIAKSLAVIWCTVCSDLRWILGFDKDQVIWKNEDEVADAYAHFQEDSFYVDFVRIFMKVTKFSTPH